MSSIIWCIYFIIICCDALMCNNCSNCTIALHQRIVLMFVKARFENLDLLLLWEFKLSIDSNKLESLIERYRRLFIRFRSYRSFDRSPDKKWYFVRRTIMKHVDVRQLQQLHDRITSKISFWNIWKCDSKV